MNDLLNPLGFVVVEVPDAEACLNVIKTFSPDAFLIDRRMPGMDGPQLATRLREMNLKQPIIMVSANANEDAPPAESNPSYDSYLIKPVRLDSLVEKLGQHLNLTWRYDPKPADAPGPSFQAAPAQLPSEEWLEEIIGWAEVGALGKIRELINRMEDQEAASPELIAHFRQYVDRVNLDGLVNTVRALR